MRYNRLYIPDEVRESVALHVKKAIGSAVEAYYSASEEEDSLAAHLCALLKIGTQYVRVRSVDVPGDWQWSIDYTKFRGRGKNATEKVLGADGIFEINVNGFNPGKKSLLFQAKKELSTDNLLLPQCVNLSTWREAACVINFTDSGYYAYFIDDILRSRGRIPDTQKRISLDEFFLNWFLACKVGDMDLQYHAKEKILQWKSCDSEIVATNFFVNNRARLNISRVTNSHFDLKKIDKIVSRDDIYKFRMKATKEEFLNIDDMEDISLDDLKNAKKNMSLAYHPDQYVSLGCREKEILTERMKEINSVYDEVRWRVEGKEKGFRYY